MFSTSIFVLSLCMFLVEAEPLQDLAGLHYEFVDLIWRDSRQRYLGHEDVHTWATFEMRLNSGNTSIWLNMSRNRELVHPKFLTRTVGNGTTTVHKKAKTECVYQGDVWQMGESRVTLLGCYRTYRGYLFNKGVSWKIRPYLGNKLRGTHVLSRVRNGIMTGMTPCPVEGHFNHTVTHRRRYRRNTDVRILELYVVFSHEMYTNHLNSDKKRAEKYAKDMALYLDTMYKIDVDVRIALVGVEVWETRDMVTMVTDANELLGRFIEYGKTDLTSFKYDLAALIADQNFDYNIAGMAHVDVMCSPLSAAVIKHFRVADPSLKSAVTLAHEIGHVLGLVHDTANCACADKTKSCIMAADTSSDPQSFSQCSKKALAKIFREGGASCLYDAPPHVFGGPVCGNGVKEQGEVCDCGNIAECMKDRCCKYGCKLRPGAQCSSGGCCHNCQVVSAGRICRGQQNQCDLEEFCDGTKSECPANLHLPDMDKCGTSTNEGFCYKGKCRHAQAQCEYIWGPGSNAGDPNCYVANMDGDVMGNCGASRTGGATNFNKCDRADIMCGMLQCVTKNTSPLVGVGSRIINRTKSAYTCISVAIDLGDDVPDPGLVDEGSPCFHFNTPPMTPRKEDGVCLAGKCVVLNTVPKTTCAKNSLGEVCSNHGTCANDGGCFCDDGYTGKDCSKVGGVTRVRESIGTTLVVVSTSSTAAGTSSQSTGATRAPDIGCSDCRSDHLYAIIFGCVGGAIGVVTLCVGVCWRLKIGCWRRKRERETTTSQKKHSTAWSGKGNPSKPHKTSFSTNAHINGSMNKVGASTHVGADHQVKGRGQGHGRGHRRANQNGRGRGRTNGQMRRPGRFSTSDYGSQESIDFIE